MIYVDHLERRSATETASEHFSAWYEYWGRLGEFHDVDALTGKPLVTRLFGFENCSVSERRRGEVPAGGSSYGYVMQGSATISSDQGAPAGLEEGMWFTSPDGVTVDLTADSRVVVSQRVGFKGLRAFGGPIETAGRLRYIDLCSDTLLACPPLLGDPCLNHLHFPPRIEQTEHTHPSLRSGAIARGQGCCETPAGRSELAPGVIFSIPAEGRHRFVTEDRTLDVIAYHPDSDWGPTDQEHPMINRTWIDGKKLDNSSGVHAEADVIGR